MSLVPKKVYSKSISLICVKCDMCYEVYWKSIVDLCTSEIPAYIKKGGDIYGTDQHE
jgi:hypothetical protein